MRADARVQARVDHTVKAEASAVLETMGLTVPDAVRLMLTRTAQDRALPFEVWRPNAETIAAMEEARRGNLKSYLNFGALLADLDSDD